MIKFGTIKSKIENKLLESYNSEKFGVEINNFKSYVLNNKKLSKLFYLYDELVSKKGLTESESKDFINECVSMIKKIKITESELTQLKKWIRSSKSDKKYKIVDDLLSENLDIKKIVTLKNEIVKTLMEQEDSIENKVNIPITSMINVANQTLNKHLQTLSESDRKEFENIVKLSDNELIENFRKVTNELESKLNQHLLETTDESSKNKITETMSVIKNKEINKLELYKLISLNNSL